MLTNKKITFFVFNNETGKYERGATCPAWVHKRRFIRNSDFGTRKVDRFDLRVGTQYIKEIGVGDLVLFGESQSNRPDFEKCMRISSITENDFGSQPHWHFEAEFKYM